MITRTEPESAAARSGSMRDGRDHRDGADDPPATPMPLLARERTFDEPHAPACLGDAIKIMISHSPLSLPRFSRPFSPPRRLPSAYRQRANFISASRQIAKCLSGLRRCPRLLRGC